MSYIIHLQSETSKIVTLSLTPLVGKADYFDVQVHLDTDGRSAESIKARRYNEYGFTNLYCFLWFNPNLNSKDLFFSIESFLPHIDFDGVKLSERSVFQSKVNVRLVNSPLDSQGLIEKDARFFVMMCQVLGIDPMQLCDFFAQEEPASVLADVDRYVFMTEALDLSLSLCDDNLHIQDMWKNYNDYMGSNALKHCQTSLVSYFTKARVVSESLNLLFGVLNDRVDRMDIQQENDSRLMKELFQRICLLLIAHQSLERVDSKKETEFFHSLVSILPGSFDHSIDLLKAMNARLFNVYWSGLRNYHLKLEMQMSAFNDKSKEEGRHVSDSSFEEDIQRAIALSLKEVQPIDDEDDDVVSQKAMDFSMQSPVSNQDLDSDLLLAIELAAQL